MAKDANLHILPFRVVGDVSNCQLSVASFQFPVGPVGRVGPVGLVGLADWSDLLTGRTCRTDTAAAGVDIAGDVFVRHTVKHVADGRGGLAD